jgi:hypothetical protein
MVWRNNDICAREIEKMNASLSRLVLPTLVALGLAACASTGGLQPGQCSAPPVSADLGPVPAMAGQSSVDIELSNLYIIARVKDMLGTVPPGATSGAFVNSVALVDASSGGTTTPTIVIMLEPWLLGQSGQPASLQRFYRLTLKLTPHLITPQTVPDATKRQQLLCPTAQSGCDSSQGALLSFDLLDLYNVSFSRRACDSPDVIDTRLVPEIYQNLANQSPLSLPTSAIGAVLSSAAGGAINLTDVNVAADGLLKIGLVYGVGSTHAFDRQTMQLSRYPGSDWVVNIDPSIMTAAVRNRMLSALQSMAPGSTLTTFSTTFTPGVILANGTAALSVPGICGTSATVTIAVRNPTQLCKDVGSRSAIVSWTDMSSSTGNFCINLKTFWDNIGVGTAFGPPTVWPTLAIINFPAGANDTFYGTALDLDSAFVIAGRSTMMDARSAASGTPRTAAPAKCPGVP